MKLLQEIKTTIISQNLSQRCTLETVQMTTTFNQYVSVERINKIIKIDELNHSFSQVSIPYIEYDELDNIFIFYNDVFSKLYDVLEYHGNQSSAKWVSTIKNEYVLMSDVNDIMGNTLKRTLPLIYKNS